METRDEPCIAPSEMTRFCIPAFIGMAWRGEALVWIQSHVRYCAMFVCTVFGSSDVNLNQTQFKTISKHLLLFPIMNLTEQTNLSRANSRASGRSRNGSSMSRNQSLIKKNIHLQDLKPADVLIERFVAWKAIVQQLTAYFEVCFHPYQLTS